MLKLKRPGLALAAAVAMVLLAACGAADSQQEAVTVSPSAAATLSAAQAAFAPAGTTLGVQTQGDVIGWLSSAPTQPVRGAAQMDVYLVGADGKPVSGAKVTLDTDMTNMSHGPYLVEAQPVGGGHYAGQVNFSMPGPWRVIAIVERPGQATAKLRFNFSVNLK